MILGLLKEQGAEQRVALLPEIVSKLVQAKVEVYVEKGAGTKAFQTDEAYRNAGAKIFSRDELLKKADLFVQIGEPSIEIIQSLSDKQVWLSQYNPLWNTDLVKSFLANNITSFSMDSIPRTTRAQAMDVLSSMATVAGYKAVLQAANELPNFFPMFMTAAGTIRPATVLILGAGVAGLQSIAIARKLGAQVEAFDVRAAVKEEVNSLGAKFVEVEGAIDDSAAGGYAVEQTEEFKKKQQEVINDHAAKADVVICTAQIPGRKAPLLIPTEAVERMRPGSVIIDLAASSGGNCELTKNSETVIYNEVKIIGQSEYPSLMPIDASKMFGKNVFNFLQLLIAEDGSLNLNFEDDIVKGTCITHSGEIYNERVKSVVES
ncbi:Re/Si-specific NAD(P)(+) transhydrogenase subunit alpha [Ancylomarina euxinus]|uniref:NAD(P) transhydrogenase subunit alpha part 1 n=1 Tax=Ancylomarina euxinus TaxID=2283627 RepID=A0A425XWK4_9BACT|nr:Re/Si-specific NAD(P)(+) transhydrogenase subunit alpha [Ancylomarina euxinus]MCZ4696376.1 Re/Si-specific NAD(P)(+) transhydrogenase subunit alpha [Ancylomarina euxinus]MUP16471.1 Re/Si-specific NAD(P)(+) transhydrogenase subunit alpha [Ancylomarina euxinus]RRG19028.1 Re/Si-specific NAD(P)(+) transhydrogenase subunit alpha [Ancylomarina euxinus]